MGRKLPPESAVSSVICRAIALVSRTAIKLNRFDRHQPVSSLVDYFTSEDLWTTSDGLLKRLGLPTSSNPVLPLALGKLARNDFLTIPDAILSHWLTETKDEIFYISSSAQSSARNAWLLIGAKLVMQWEGSYCRKGTWPSDIARETCSVLLGNRKNTGSTLAELYRDPKNGPLCHATVAMLLDYVDLPQARPFAVQALAKLTPEDFVRDYEVLAPALGGESVTKTVRAFQTLDADELEAVLELVESEPVVKFLSSVHSNPIEESQQEGLFWYHLLEKPLRESMQRIARKKILGDQ